jgi:hypothetical protein
VNITPGTVHTQTYKIVLFLYRLFKKLYYVV